MNVRYMRLLKNIRCCYLIAALFLPGALSVSVYGQTGNANAPQGMQPSLVMPGGQPAATAGSQDAPVLKKAADNPGYINIKSSGLTRDSILVGDQVVWSTVFEMPDGKNLAIAPYGEAAGQIDVLHDFRLDTLSVKDGIARLEARLLFTSFDSGYYRLPQPLIIAGERDTIYFDPPSIAVNTIQIDTASFKAYDIKGQITYPVTFKEVLPWILLALGIIVVVYLLYRYIKYRKENRDFFGKPIVKDPPHIIALRELEKLRTQKLWQSGKEKQFYTGITDTLREYIEARYAVSAMEKTTTEIMESLADKQVESRTYNELNGLFKLADLVKFAKYTPLEAENEEAVPVAVRFVNSTFMQEMEQAKNNVEQKEEGK